MYNIQNTHGVARGSMHLVIRIFFLNKHFAITSTDLRPPEQAEPDPVSPSFLMACNSDCHQFRHQAPVKTFMISQFNTTKSKQHENNYAHKSIQVHNLD